MPSAKPRYNKEEFAQRGEAIYEREVRPTLTEDDVGKFVVIDIETEEFEINEDEIAADDQLRARLPDPQIWLRRVGQPYVRRFGRGMETDRK